MDIVLNNLAKRYRFEWIFRNFNYEFQTGERYAILGPNGAGKSTLMKVLSGHLSPSKGKISFQLNGKTVDPDKVYQQISYAAPYIDLIEELSLEEAILFHQRFKPFVEGLQAKDLIEILGFEKSRKKDIKYFSSGMKQRLKLVLALCSEAQLLLLDEPTSNLDQQGFEWYHGLIERFAKDRLVIVASNVATDYSFCTAQINILDYKKKR